MTHKIICTPRYIKNDTPSYLYLPKNKSKLIQIVKKIPEAHSKITKEQNLSQMSQMVPKSSSQKKQKSQKELKKKKYNLQYAI